MGTATKKKRLKLRNSEIRAKRRKILKNKTSKINQKDFQNCNKWGTGTRKTNQQVLRGQKNPFAIEGFNIAHFESAPLLKTPRCSSNSLNPNEFQLNEPLDTDSLLESMILGNWKSTQFPTDPTALPLEFDLPEPPLEEPDVTAESGSPRGAVDEIINSQTEEMNGSRKNQLKKNEKGVRSGNKDRRLGRATGRKSNLMKNEWLRGGGAEPKTKDTTLRERTKSGMRRSAVGLGRGAMKKGRGGVKEKQRVKRNGRRKMSIGNVEKGGDRKRGTDLQKGGKDEGIVVDLGFEKEGQEMDKSEKEMKRKKTDKKKMKANVRKFKTQLMKNYGVNIGKFMTSFEGNLRKSQEKMKKQQPGPGMEELTGKKKTQVKVVLDEESEEEPDFDYSRGDKLIAIEKNIALRKSQNSKQDSKGNDTPLNISGKMRRSARKEGNQTGVREVPGSYKTEPKGRRGQNNGKPAKSGLRAGLRRGKTMNTRTKSVIGRSQKGVDSMAKNYGRKKSVTIGRKRGMSPMGSRNPTNLTDPSNRKGYFKSYKKGFKEREKRKGNNQNLRNGKVAKTEKEEQKLEIRNENLERSDKSGNNGSKGTPSTQHTQNQASNIFKEEIASEDISTAPNVTPEQKSLQISEKKEGTDQKNYMASLNSEEPKEKVTVKSVEEKKVSNMLTSRRNPLQSSLKVPSKSGRKRPRSINELDAKKKAKSIRTRRRTGFNNRSGGGQTKTHSTIKSKRVGTSIFSGNPRTPFGGKNRKKAASETNSVGSWSFTNLEKLGIRRHKNLIEFIKKKEGKLPPFMKARTVVKNFGVIKAFVVNTHKGCVRSGNEDRVSILLNAQKKFKVAKRKMRNCAMFSVFDGHGGTDCSNYLKENLHNKVLARVTFQPNMDSSIKRIYNDLDDEYLKRAVKKNHNFAGSCANSLFVFDEELVVVNTGDSRTVASYINGKRVEPLSFDHKPGYYNEFARVIREGGQLYRVSSNLKTIENMFYTVTNYSDVLQLDEVEKTTKHLCFGPWRVKPGGLSVSR